MTRPRATVEAEVEAEAEAEAEAGEVGGATKGHLHRKSMEARRLSYQQRKRGAADSVSTTIEPGSYTGNMQSSGQSLRTPPKELTCQGHK